MTREDAIKILKEIDIPTNGDNEKERNMAFNMAIKALEQEPCEDCISRKSIKQKLQEHHDFFVNAYGGFSNLPLNEKSRVDEISNCIAEVLNEPSVTPQEPIDYKAQYESFAKKAEIVISQLRADRDRLADVFDKIRAEIMDFEEELFHRPNTDYSDYAAVRHCMEIIDKYKAESEDKE